jgi:hypothetical protein
MLGGDSLRSIVRDWNAIGVRTAAGGAWSNRGLAAVLTNPHIANLRLLDDKLIHGTWEPLIDRRTWDQLCAVFADPARRTSPGSQRRHLLSGILRCGVCGTPMGSRGHQAGTRYLCLPRAGYQACGKVSIEIERTDDFVRTAVRKRFASTDLAGVLAQADPEAVVRSLMEEREALARDYGLGDITRADWDAARAGLDARITAAEEAAAQPRPVRIDVARFDAEPIEAQRRFVSWAFTELSCAPWVPGTVGFDYDRIKLKARRAEAASNPGTNPATGQV